MFKLENEWPLKWNDHKLSEWQSEMKTIYPSFTAHFVHLLLILLYILIGLIHITSLK